MSYDCKSYADGSIATRRIFQVWCLNGQRPDEARHKPAALQDDWRQSSYKRPNSLYDDILIEILWENGKTSIRKKHLLGKTPMALSSMQWWWLTLTIRCFCSNFVHYCLLICKTNFWQTGNPKCQVPCYSWCTALGEGADQKGDDWRGKTPWYYDGG